MLLVDAQAAYPGYFLLPSCFPGSLPPGCLHLTSSVLARGQILLLMYILGLIIHWEVQILPVTNILQQTLLWNAELIIC